VARPLALVVLGTRPEAIKLAPVILALRARRGLAVRVCSTGQHRQLLAAALSDFGLRADIDLALMRPGQRLNDLCAAALAKLGALIRRLKPGLVVVQGDTTTAMAGALAAFHERVPVAHVEAGLRTFDLAGPYPEEANRALIDALAALKFAPTPAALANLRAERISDGVAVTGNTGIDALRWAVSRRRRPGPALAAALERCGPEGFALVTLHRRESLGAPLRSICEGLRAVLDAEPGLRLLWPVHLNPEVRRAAAALGRHERADLLPHLGYLDAAAALSRCRFVMTDSGGLQEEAAFLGKPTLVLRRVTDRPEAVKAGIARVAGVEGRGVAREARRLLADRALFARMSRRSKAFGDGRAAPRIAASIARFLRA
jgi:UDP-N-acetylglucosamine 2-epimerase (non-hydrolysing)